MLKIIIQLKEIKYIKSLDNENNDPTFNNIDSLLYNVAEIFYFDFNHLDSSLYKFKTIIDNYPESDYRYKSLIIMNIEQPDTIWEDIIANDYDERIHGIGEIDEIAQLRDKAWNLLGKSKDDAINEFLEINAEHDDDKSLYIIAFIYDDYFHDVINASKYYKQYSDSYPDREYYQNCTNRMLEIENIYQDKIDYLEDKLNFKYGFDWFRNEFNYDSSLYYLNLSQKSNDRKFFQRCRQRKKPQNSSDAFTFVGRKNARSY